MAIKKKLPDGVAGRTLLQDNRPCFQDLSDKFLLKVRVREHDKASVLDSKQNPKSQHFLFSRHCKTIYLLATRNLKV